MENIRKPDGRGGVDTDLVKRLIAAQFPQWSALPVRLLPVEGWDNRTYRLGEDMSVRLPSAASYEPQVEKEHRWLPYLAEKLPLPVPAPIGRGVPGQGYPYHWSVYRWIEGETADPGRIDSLDRFATDLADFLHALQALDATDGPVAGPHSFYRGGDLRVYEQETVAALDALGGRVAQKGAARVWEAAMAARRDRPDVWVHGDIASGNLLVRNGRLSAVIDFGSSSVGDPACDLQITWTFFSGRDRETFRTAIAADPGCWARARGWALWKSLIQLPEKDDADPVAALNHRIIREVIGEHDAIG